MSISPFEPNASKVIISMPGNPAAGFQPNKIEIDFKAVIELDAENRERIRNILTQAFTEILYGDIAVTFEDEPEDWPDKPLPWNLMREELLENGYKPAEAEHTDTKMVGEILCGQCCCGGQIPEGFRGRGYRVYALCPHCGAYQEI